MILAAAQADEGSQSKRPARGTDRCVRSSRWPQVLPGRPSHLDDNLNQSERFWWLRTRKSPQACPVKIRLHPPVKSHDETSEAIVPWYNRAGSLAEFPPRGTMSGRCSSRRNRRTNGSGARNNQPGKLNDQQRYRPALVPDDGYDTKTLHRGLDNSPLHTKIASKRLLLRNRRLRLRRYRKS